MQRTKIIPNQNTAIKKRAPLQETSVITGVSFFSAAYTNTKRKGMRIMLSIDTISAEELDAYVGRQDAVIIDLRDAEEYERSHVKTAVNIPYEEIQRCRRFPKDKLLVLYCSRGSSSLFAARELMKMGYTVKSVVGGIRCYRGSNLYFSNVHSKIKKVHNKEKNNMKYMFASDIHGSAYYCKKMLEAYEQEKADRLILLGDILYHGPRNDLPKEYAPKEVIAMLNAKKDELYVVRGNCEAEVDQMVLEFPIMADYCIIMDGERTIYASHGHVYNENNLPPMKNGDIFIHGHTHVLRAEKKENYTILNPGSVSIPKEGNIPTYAILEDGVFSIRGFEGEIVKELELS